MFVFQITHLSGILTEVLVTMWMILQPFDGMMLGRFAKRTVATLLLSSRQAENDFVWELISKQKTVTIWGAWIGLSRGDDSKFYWVDDTPLLESQFAIWRPGQPDNFWNKENCGHIIEGKWNDLPCDLLGEVFNAPVILCQK